MPTYAARRLFAGSAWLSLLKPFVECVPSQKGLFFESPQRHNATPRVVE